MKNNPLVTMITYCYNGGRFVHKYFEAILSQTYQNIELIFYNNGSEDNTSDVINKYVPLLEKKGIVCNIITLEKNNPKTCQLKMEAIKMMHGDYFFGCDSDDIIHSDYVEKMVSYLEENKSKGIVFCQLNKVLEKDGSIIGVMKQYKQEKEYESFNNIIIAEKTVFPCISYMMSTEWLDKINPKRDFYVSKYGENFQILIPFLYHNLQGYVDEPLGDYTIRKDSFSSQIDYKKRYEILDEERIIISNTLKSISDEVFEKYNIISLKRIARDQFYVAFRIKERKLLKESFLKLCDTGSCTIKEKIVYCLCKSNVFWSILLKVK